MYYDLIGCLAKLIEKGNLTIQQVIIYNSDLQYSAMHVHVHVCVVILVVDILYMYIYMY